jgi:hypothetical protein
VCGWKKKRNRNVEKKGKKQEGSHLFSPTTLPSPRGKPLNIMILTEILTNFKSYPAFIAKKLWRFLIRELRCPDHSCKNQCRLIGWGTRKRKPKGTGVPEAVCVIQRFFCKAHSHTISFLPPFLLSRLHYDAQTVNEFVDGFMQGKTIASLCRDTCNPDERTVRRWVNVLRTASDEVKKGALYLLSANFYTMDEFLVKHQREMYQESSRPSKLIALWALLRALAIRIAEGRVPYHYCLVGPSP